MFTAKRTPDIQSSLVSERLYYATLFLLQFIFVALVLVGPIALAESEPENMSESNLETALVSAQTLSREFRLDGEVEAVHKATISAQTAGTIQEIFVDVNDYVEQSAIIMRLKDTSQQAKMKKAQAGEKEAISYLSKAEDEYKRIKDIYAKKVVPKSTMDDATHALSAAKARLDSARASLEDAREELSHTLIKAPYSGIVTKRHVEPGETVQPGMELMTGVSLNKLRVNVNVPQSLISKIRRYGKAYVFIEVYTDVDADADTVVPSDTVSDTAMSNRQKQVAVEKITVFPIADQASNTFKVRLDLPEGITGLFPGMYIKTSLVTGEKEVLMVPAKSIVHRSEVTAVYVLHDDGVINFRHVRLGSVQRNSEQGGSADASQVILSGLSAGEKVAIDPIQAGINLITQRRQQSGRQQSTGMTNE